MKEQPCPRTLALFKPGVIFPTVFHCFTRHLDQWRCELCGEIKKPPIEEKESHHLNHDQSVAVASEYTWLPIETCPRNVKVQLLGGGGVASYGLYNGDPFYSDWAPLPRRR